MEKSTGGSLLEISFIIENKVKLNNLVPKYYIFKYNMVGGNQNNPLAKHFFPTHILETDNCSIKMNI